MDPTLWLIALGSTLAWSGFDAIRKRLVQEVPVASLSLWVSLAQVPGYLVWMAFQAPVVPPGEYWGPAAISVAANLLANLLFLYAMSVAELSIAIPILSFTPVFVAISGGPLLGEHLRSLQWVGVVLVSLGALVINAPPGARQRPWLMVTEFLHARGILPMMGVSMLWALTPIFDKMAVRTVPAGEHGMVLALGVAAGMALYLGVRGQLVSTRPRGRQAWGWLALGGVTNVVALGLQLLAISVMVVSVFEAFKRAAGLLIAMGLGALWFSEGFTLRKAAGGAMMAAGVALVLVEF